MGWPAARTPLAALRENGCTLRPASGPRTPKGFSASLRHDGAAMVRPRRDTWTAGERDLECSRRRFSVIGRRWRGRDHDPPVPLSTAYRSPCTAPPVAVSRILQALRVPVWRRVATPAWQPPYASPTSRCRIYDSPSTHAPVPLRP